MTCTTIISVAGSSINSFLEILDFRAAPESGKDAGLAERKEDLETGPQIPQKLSIFRITVCRKMTKYNLN